MKIKSFWCTLFVVLMYLFIKPDGVNAYTPEPVPIYTVQEMLAVADNPSASYVLMCDLDMAGVDWPAITFTGSFDGGGHALLNLTVSRVSEEMRKTYDGNHKVYDTCCGGLFSILETASVKNLKLIGVNVACETECDCFLGGIAGYASQSLIENCEIIGTIRLDVTGRMFGVGGIAGYGDGLIKNNRVDVTLINIDLDRETRDEQFLGGAFGAGYPDLSGNEIKLAGYISDHGYVHSGGLIGMYIIFPSVNVRDGYIQNNRLSGYITFFEDNTNRRAYCEPNIGEVLDWYFTNSGNAYDFKRDERFDYTVDLLPHDSEHTEFTAEITESGCDTFGYTTYTCTADGCGYSYIADYTLHSHAPGSVENIIFEPTLSGTGLGEYVCPDCGSIVYVSIPMLTPTPMPTPTPEPTAALAVAQDTSEVQDDKALSDITDTTDTDYSAQPAATTVAQSDDTASSRSIILSILLVICCAGVVLMIFFAVKTVRSHSD